MPAAQRLKNMWRVIASPVVKRLQAIMSCGLTPQKLALTLCLGIAFGIIPLVWGTSLICIIIAQVFRLNHVALQSVNYLLWPVHLALLMPFFKLGTWLFPWGPPLPGHLISTLLHTPGQFSLNVFGWLTLKALAAWLVTVIPAALLTYGMLRTTVFRESTQTS
jgi:uncharacterized protein (DUF2062 family)